MLGVTGKYVYVFQPTMRLNVSERIIFANLATSKKDTYLDESGERKQKRSYMYWPAKFVGDAFEAAKALRDKDCINILHGAIENTYSAERKAYFITVVVFAFDLVPSEHEQKKNKSEQEVTDTQPYSGDTYKSHEEYFKS